jgi:DNA polymerase-3 subunit alpha
VLSHEAQDSAKVYKYSTELKSMGLQLLPPDVNESGEGFTPVENTVRYGLTAIKGMGTTSVQAMVEARKAGPFKSIYDFCARLGSGAVNRRGLESLIAAGAFDSLMPVGSHSGLWRAQLHEAIENALAQGQRLCEDRLRGQSGLFGITEGGDDGVGEILPLVEPWPATEIARREKAAIGFYLSTHPLDNYKDVLAGMKIKNIAEFDDLTTGDVVRIAGMISGLQIRTSKRGNRFAQFRLEDRSGGIKGVVLGDSFNKLSPMLVDDGMFIAEGNIEAAEGQEPTLKINELKSLDEAEAVQARELNIRIPLQHRSEAYFERLYGLLERDRGRTNVFITINTGETEVRLHAEALSVTGSRSLQKDLEAVGCTVDWIH